MNFLCDLGMKLERQQHGSSLIRSGMGCLCVFYAWHRLGMGNEHSKTKWHHNGIFIYLRMERLITREQPEPPLRAFIVICFSLFTPPPPPDVKIEIAIG